MAKPTMVSRASKNVCKKCTTCTSSQRPTERSCRKVEATRNAEFTATGSLDNLRQKLLAEGILERVSNLITNNRKTSSIKHYESSWKKWCGCCSERKISPTRLSINYVLYFLAELFEKWFEYRTIGTHRSAVSVFYDPIGNIGVGKHRRVSALMLGIFNKRPTQPKYPDIFIWIPDILLTLKVSMLLALLSASKASEITSSRVDYLKKYSSVYTFAIPHLTKTKSEGHKTPTRSEVLQFPRR